MAKVTFTESGARRIVAATRAYERGNRDQPPIKFRQPGGDDGALVLRIVRATAQLLPYNYYDLPVVYDDLCTQPESYDPGSSEQPEPELLTVWNYLYTIPADGLVFVVQAKNGCWYAVGASCPEPGLYDSASGDGSDYGCDCVAIGGEDLTAIPNYNPDAVQFLGHDLGCLKWFDITDCGSGS